MYVYINSVQILFITLPYLNIEAEDETLLLNLSTSVSEGPDFLPWIWRREIILKFNISFGFRIVN